MRRLLLNLMYDASTSKYAKYFPYPMLLLNIKNEEDVILDLSAKAYGKNKDNKLELIHDFLDNYPIDEFDELIVNCGEYPADGHYYYYFEYLLLRLDIKIPISIMGPYATIFKERIKELNNVRASDNLNPISIRDTNYDVRDVIIPDDMLFGDDYPKVGDKPKAQLKISYGCPRDCAMCPVPILYGKRYKFDRAEKAIERIKYYYDKGIRYFAFTDDNLSATKSWLRFLRELKNADLKNCTFISQEGLEVLSFHDEEVCQLLSELNFQDIKCGIENIKEDFLLKIKKYYSKVEDIQLAIDNIKKYNLDVGMYFLIGLDETEEDILDNLKFIAKNKLKVRANIIRDYENSSLSTKNVDKKVSDSKLKDYKSLSYAISWLTDKYDIDIFQDDALEKLINSANLDVSESINKVTIKGKINYGFKTSRFMRCIKFLYQNKYNDRDVKVKINENKTELIVSLILKDDPLF